MTRTEKIALLAAQADQAAKDVEIAARWFAAGSCTRADLLEASRAYAAAIRLLEDVRNGKRI